MHVGSLTFQCAQYGSRYITQTHTTCLRTLGQICGPRRYNITQKSTQSESAKMHPRHGYKQGRHKKCNIRIHTCKRNDMKYINAQRMTNSALDAPKRSWNFFSWNSRCNSRRSEFSKPMRHSHCNGSFLPPAFCTSNPQWSS